MVPISYRPPNSILWGLPKKGPEWLKTLHVTCLVGPSRWYDKNLDSGLGSRVERDPCVTAIIAFGIYSWDGV